MSQQNYSSHPLPSHPGQGYDEHRQNGTRPRAKSGFSFKSAHSRKSSGSGPKIDLHETHEEKESRRLTTKANPSLAITEMEPSAVASAVKTSMAPLRAIQHRDAQGNPIVDPDRSNPTRSRWERPLDTIRSFEAAIDGGYRKSFIRSESAENFNRRSSYYGGTQVTADERPRFQGGRNQRESYQQQRPESYYNSFDNAGPSNGYYPNRARYPRTASEPQFSSGHAVYPVPGNQQSYETVTTSSSGEPVGYATDPSSENSSVDRVAGVQAREPGESYSFNKSQQYGQSNGLQERYAPNGQGFPPAVPRKQVGPPRVPIKLGATSGNAAPPPVASRPPVGEKRKSWFGRLSRKA